MATVPAVVSLASCLVVLAAQLGSPSGKLDTCSAYYRITTYKDTQRDRAHQRQRHPAPGAPPGGRPDSEPFYDQVYNWFPGQTYQTC